MMEEVVVDALNSQYNFERLSSALYDALACDLDYLNLVGMAKWMARQADEEQGHAEKFSTYITDRNCRVVVGAIPEFQNPLGESGIFDAGLMAFEKALEHEKKVSARIQALHDIAVQSGDDTTAIFLQWFLTEQVEEEKTVEEIITKFKLAVGNGAAILEIDEELGEGD